MIERASRKHFELTFEQDKTFEYFYPDLLCLDLLCSILNLVSSGWSPQLGLLSLVSSAWSPQLGLLSLVSSAWSPQLGLHSLVSSAWPPQLGLLSWVSSARACFGATLLECAFENIAQAHIFVL